MTFSLKLPDLFNKPYYFLRPSQAVRRLKRKFSGHQLDQAFERIILPWGLPIRVRPNDYIGERIVRAGVYDLSVNEALWRLLDPGETAIDAGANIGQMTSLMAKRVGGSGSVLSFEPHPDVFQELNANVEVWKTSPNLGEITLHEKALSKEVGTGSLRVSSNFAVNRGTASLDSGADGSSQEGTDQEGAVWPVSVVRLDDILDDTLRIGVMKLDVEGREMDLLQGATRLLTERRLRDIIFEENQYYPSPVTTHLEKLGYKIFRVELGPLAVRVTPAQPGGAQDRYESPNYLATLDAPRALARFRMPGYQALWAGANSAKSRLLPRLLLATALLLVVRALINKKRPS